MSPPWTHHHSLTMRWWSGRSAPSSGPGRRMVPRPVDSTTAATAWSESLGWKVNWRPCQRTWVAWSSKRLQGCFFRDYTWLFFQEISRMFFFFKIKIMHVNKPKNVSCWVHRRKNTVLHRCKRRTAAGIATVAAVNIGDHQPYPILSSHPVLSYPILSFPSLSVCHILWQCLRLTLSWIIS